MPETTGRGDRGQLGAGMRGFVEAQEETLGHLDVAILHLEFGAQEARAGVEGERDAAYAPRPITKGFRTKSRNRSSDSERAR